MKDYSNYHTNSKDKILSDGVKLLELAKNGFDGYPVLIKGVQYTAVIIDKYSANRILKKIIIDVDIQRGDVVAFNGDNWLVVTQPKNKHVYNESTIELCNNTLHIKTGETKTQTGIDSMGRPVYTTTPVYSDFPCIVSSSKSAGYDSNQTINLPSGQLFITLPYTEIIKEGMEFNMYQQKYKVKNVDYSESMNQVGIVTLTVERFV